MMFDGLHAEGGGNMGFSSAGAADQDNVLRAVHELTAMKLPYSGLVDLTGREVEAGEVLVSWEAGRLHVIGNGPDLTFCDLSLQQLGEHRHRGVECRCALFHQVGDGLCHAVHLQAAQHDDDGAAGRIMTHGGLLRSVHADRHSVRHWPLARCAEQALAVCRC